MGNNAMRCSGARKATCETASSGLLFFYKWDVSGPALSRPIFKLDAFSLFSETVSALQSVVPRARCSHYVDGSIALPFP